MRRQRAALIGAGVLLVMGLALWWQARPAPLELSDLSRAEFARMEKTIRQAMWRKAIGKGSFWGLMSSPRSLWTLATTRINRIELLAVPSHVEVRTQSNSGPHFYDLINLNRGEGLSDWQVLSEGTFRQASTVSLNGFQNLRFVKVEGGLGLIGGKLSPGDGSDELNEFISNAPPRAIRLHTNSSTNEPKKSFFDTLNIGYDVRPLEPIEPALPLHPGTGGTTSNQ